METKSVNVPEQSLSRGLTESKSKIDRLLSDINHVAIDQIKDEEVQDKLLKLNEQIYQELRSLVSDHQSKIIMIKNILSGQL